MLILAPAPSASNESPVRGVLAYCAAGAAEGVGDTGLRTSINFAADDIERRQQADDWREHVVDLLHEAADRPEFERVRIEVELREPSFDPQSLAQTDALRIGSW